MSNQNHTYQLVVNDTKTISTSDLRQNDSRILSLFGKESGSNYSFKGLMRSLNLHQQSLSRALGRLEDLGLIERSPSGFKLTKDGESIMSSHYLGGGITNVNLRRKYSPLLQTYIPIRMRISEIAENLIGKWFDKLRWAGSINEGSQYVLQWISIDDDIRSGVTSSPTTTAASFQVNLRLMSDYVIIETNAVSDREKVDAMVGSYRILQLVTRLFQRKLDSDGSSYITSMREAYSANN